MPNIILQKAVVIRKSMDKISRVSRRSRPIFRGISPLANVPFSRRLPAFNHQNQCQHEKTPNSIESAAATRDIYSPDAKTRVGGSQRGNS